MAPMEVVSRKCPSRSQGGGVYIYTGGQVDFSGCSIYENDAGYVRVHDTAARHSMPPWKKLPGTDPVLV